MSTIEEVLENTQLIEDPLIFKGELFSNEGYLGKVLSVSTVFIFTDEVTYRYCFSDSIYSELFVLGVEEFRLEGGN